MDLDFTTGGGRQWLPIGVAALLGMAAPVSPLHAQTSVQFSAAGTLERTTRDGDQENAQPAPRVAATLEHTVAKGHVRLFYELDAGDYTTPGDWSFLVQSAGASVRIGHRDVGTRLFVGGSAWWRANGASWADAAYRGFSGFANLEGQPVAGLTARTGYRLDARRFPDLAGLDQVEHRGFVSLLDILPSRTTLVGEISLGAKAYNGFIDSNLSAVEVAASPNQPSATAVQHRARGAGRGPGFFLTPGFIPGPGARQTHILAGEVTIFTRISQSIFDRNSVRLEASRRETFGDTPPAVVATPELFFDDGVYDDPFASDQSTIRLGLKRVYPSGLVLDGGGWWFRRDYNGTPALDAGLPYPDLRLRRDEVRRAAVDCTVPLWPVRTTPWELDLTAGYEFTDSRSNDTFYTYTSHRVRLGAVLRY